MLATLAGCFGPPSLSRWEGCLHEDARLVEEDDRLTVGSGEGWVVNASTSWGELPFVTDMGSYRRLIVELPENAVGVVDLAGRRAMFREGGLVLDYDSRSLVGTAQVVEAGDLVTVRLSATATSPVKDYERVGDVPLVGELVLRRVRGELCPR